MRLPSTACCGCGADDGREQSPRPGSLGCAMGSPGTEPSAAPNVTPQVTPSPNVSPAGSPMGSPRGPTFPPVQPFNMWDLQTAAQVRLIGKRSINSKGGNSHSENKPYMFRAFLLFVVMSRRSIEFPLASM